MMKTGTRKPPLVGLTARIDTTASPLILVRQAYCHAVSLGGGIPLLIAPTTPLDRIGSLIDGLDALILTGGEDINPLFFNSQPHPKLGLVNSARDRFELALCREWITTAKPFLGICRGLQLLNVAAGGGLWQDIATECPAAMRHTHQGPRTDPAHSVKIENDSLLSRFLGIPQGEPCREVIVNSIHHQALASPAAGFRVSATAADGIIEGIEAIDGRPILGVQWHPEELVEAYPEQLQLFKSLVAAAADSLARQ